MTVSEQLASDRMFFNLVSDAETIPDEQGVDLPPKGDVLGLIARIFEDFHQNGMLASAEWRGWYVVITDGSGQTLLSVALGTPALECSRSPLN
ncbi:hypothetical protein JKG68_07065 [Microvirga aerilata]|uniref:DUF6894 domain-containing protein n=1 Tax=Microvirga aerilata TaxID=670292 RepID=A0A936ZFD2_9HYPH|nr:hypothetical protein [Microvirga aerilata]MBL0403719.1 hypothetical protein [Microvirga aerilata]